MSAAVILLDEAIVRRRDALDLDSPEYHWLDQLAFENLLRRAGAVDLRGLEVWWGNDFYYGGLVVGTEGDSGELVVLDDGERVAVWEVLAAGWLQEPDDEADPGPDGYLATMRALKRRERSGARP